MLSLWHPGKRPGDLPLILSLICFGTYVADVVIGKLALLAAFTWPFALGEVAQFLLVLVASTLLVTAALIREAKQPRRETQNQD